jgi:hypothetical protein
MCWAYLHVATVYPSIVYVLSDDTLVDRCAFALQKGFDSVAADRDPLSALLAVQPRQHALGCCAASVKAAGLMMWVLNTAHV